MCGEPCPSSPWTGSSWSTTGGASRQPCSWRRSWSRRQPPLGSSALVQRGSARALRRREPADRHELPQRHALVRGARRMVAVWLWQRGHRSRRWLGADLVGAVSFEGVPRRPFIRPTCRVALSRCCVHGRCRACVPPLHHRVAGRRTLTTQGPGHKKPLSRTCDCGCSLQPDLCRSLADYH